MSHHTSLHRWLHAHPVATFLILTLSFLSFGKLSLDLVKIFSANADYIVMNGWMGLMDGGFRQFLELTSSALGAMACYVLFKLCEHVLTHRLSHRD